MQQAPKAVLIIGFSVVLTARILHGQTQTGDPCTGLEQKIETILAEKQKEHDNCMAAHINSPHGPETPNQCSVPACQQFHIWVFGDAGQRLRAQLQQQLNACNARIQSDQDQIREAQQLTAQYSQGSLNDGLPTLVADNSVLNAVNDLSAQADAKSNTDASGIDSGATSFNSSDSPGYLDQATAAAKQALQQAVDKVIDEGVDQVPGGAEVELATSNLKAYAQLQSGNSQQQVEGANQIAQNINDQFNTNPISQKVTGTSLNIIKVYQIRMSRTLDLVQNSFTTCFSSNSAQGCSPGEFNQQFNAIWGQPVVQPASSIFDN